MLHHPSLQSGSKTCLFNSLFTTSKEARNNISVSAMETSKKLDEIAEKWSKVKPVSSHAKNYELVWDKIKDLRYTIRRLRGCYVAVSVAIFIIQRILKQIQNNKKMK